MWQRALSGNSGGGAVRSGNYTANNKEEFTFDTGLGSSLKQVIVFCLITNSTQTPPTFNVSGWVSDYPTKVFAGYTDGYGGGRWLGQGVTDITTAISNYSCKIMDVTNGVVTVKTFNSFGEGTYYWYAE